MQITEPGVYPDLSADDYHADPCPEPSLSSSIVKVLINETPQHAWVAHPRLNPGYERTEKEIFDIGNAAHSLMLSDPKRFAVLDFDDWRKKEAQTARDAARADGRIPMLTKHWERVNAMVESGRGQLLSHRDASDAFTDGTPESTLIWVEDGLWFRARLDWKPNRGDVFDDYKSTENADPDSWARIAFNVGHDIQAAFYRRGIRAVGLSKKPKMRFVVQETSEPYALSVCQFKDEALELADRRIDQAIAKWRWCVSNGRWPGYPAHTCEIDAPPWHENQLMEREVRQAGLARQAGVEERALLALAMEFQRPI